MFEQNPETIFRSHDSQILTAGDDRFPPSISSANKLIAGSRYEPPFEQVYFKGENLLGSDRFITTVVGPRPENFHGNEEQTTIKLMELLTRISDRMVIASGGAHGVDAIAHRSALNSRGEGNVGNPTVLVSPVGLDFITPQDHYGLAIEILAKGGAVVSPYESDKVKSAGKEQYMRRDLLLAAISDVVFVVGGDWVSGTYATARRAHDLGKKVVFVQVDGVKSGSELRFESEGFTGSYDSIDLSKNPEKIFTIITEVLYKQDE